MRVPGTWQVAILVAVILLAVTPLGCSKSGDKMVGDWLIEGTEEVITFYPGRSYTSHVGGGSYRFTDNTRILLPISEPGLGGMVGNEEYDISFPDDKTMVLTQVSSGKSWTLTKAE